MESRTTTFIEAAVIVLRSSDRPLTSREVTAAALERRLIRTSGRTPEASMSAALYAELGRTPSRVAKLSTPGLARAARGSVRWAPTPEPGLAG